MLLSHNKWMQREKLFYSPVVVLSEMHTNRGTSALNNYEKVSFRDLYKELHNMALQYIIWDNFKNGLGKKKKTLCSRKIMKLFILPDSSFETSLNWNIFCFLFVSQSDFTFILGKWTACTAEFKSSETVVKFNRFYFFFQQSAWSNMYGLHVMPNFHQEAQKYSWYWQTWSS